MHTLTCDGCKKELERKMGRKEGYYGLNVFYAGIEKEDSKHASIHFCPKCMKNTLPEIMAKVDEADSDFE